MAKPIAIPWPEWKDEEDAEATLIAADQPEYFPLPAVIVNHERIWTRWQLDDDERRRIVEAGVIDIEISTFGSPLQPLTVRVPAPR